MLTKEQLQEFVLYDPETGIFTRKVDRGRNQFGSEFARWKAGKTMGTINPSGYCRISIFGSIHQAHRLAWLYHYGEWPDGLIDHINGVRHDNRIENLRVVDCAGNARNMSRSAKNKTGINGVHIHTQNGCYIAQIRVGGKARHIGRFDTIFDAACARKAAELRLGYHPNHGRAPS